MEEKREVRKQKTPSGEVVTEQTSTAAAPEEAQERREVKGIFQLRYLVYYFLGVLEVLLAFRLLFKLLGANPDSGFVSFIYSVTNVFLAPFSGIFHTATSQGVETTSVLEPATLIAIVVYGILGWGIAKLFDALLVGKE